MKRSNLAALALLLFAAVQPALGDSCCSIPKKTACTQRSNSSTALDEYIAKPDANYRYSLANTITGEGYTAYVLDMTSQKWRSSTEVDRTLWQHWLTIIKPDKVSGDTALLWINGGNNGQPAPTSVEPQLVQIALSTNTVVADLQMVPNQPLTFAGESEPRSEDQIIAYTFDKYMTTGDATWPVLLPMVKSAVRAMDTVQDYMSAVTKSPVVINKFVVSGASKRGWTTWLTAPVDSRVVAIVPAVFDALNLNDQTKHHFSAYGFYSNTMKDYVDMNIFDRLGTPKGRALMQFVDPYEYRNRITIPKYLVNATGDEFFLPDSSQFYFEALTGEKYIRYVPNTVHSLEGSDAGESMLTFYQSVLAGSKRPQFFWTSKNDGSILVRTSEKPLQVNLWQATNATARDFRLLTIGSVWKNSVLKAQAGGVYVARVPNPAKGWTAFFVELVYDSGSPKPYKFTTAVKVVPQCLPFTHKVAFNSRD